MTAEQIQQIKEKYKNPLYMQNPKTLVRIADALEVDVFDFFKKLE